MLGKVTHSMVTCGWHTLNAHTRQRHPEAVRTRRTLSKSGFSFVFPPNSDLGLVARQKACHTYGHRTHVVRCCVGLSCFLTPFHTNDYRYLSHDVGPPSCHEVDGRHVNRTACGLPLIRVARHANKALNTLWTSTYKITDAHVTHTRWRSVAMLAVDGTAFG